jgi:hypothetical protein
MHVDGFQRHAPIYLHGITALPLHGKDVHTTV